MTPTSLPHLPLGAAGLGAPRPPPPRGGQGSAPLSGESCATGGSLVALGHLQPPPAPLLQGMVASGHEGAPGGGGEAKPVKINWNSLKITLQQHAQKRREPDGGTGHCPGVPAPGDLLLSPAGDQRGTAAGGHRCGRAQRGASGSTNTCPGTGRWGGRNIPPHAKNVERRLPRLRPAPPAWRGHGDRRQRARGDRDGDRESGQGLASGWGGVGDSVPRDLPAPGVPGAETPRCPGATGAGVHQGHRGWGHGGQRGHGDSGRSGWLPWHALGGRLPAQRLAGAGEVAGTAGGGSICPSTPRLRLWH